MKLRMFAASLAAFAMTASPVLAQATQKAPTSSAVSRASAGSSEANKLKETSSIILALLAASAIIGGIVVAAGNEDDQPASP